MKKDRTYTERASYTWSEDSIRLILTPGSFAKSTYYYVQEAGYFKTEYPYFTERQNLSSFLIVYTISGRGYLEYGEREYELTAGTCFYIDCTKHHFYQTKLGEHWEFLWVHFNGNSALGYYKEFEQNGFKVLKLQKEGFVESTLRRIITINQKKDVTTELLTSNLLVNILTELLLQNCTNNGETIFVPDYIRKIADTIEKDFKSPLNLEYFAHMLNRNKFAIAREFKKYIGTTINEYIIVTRISYAKERLKFSDLTVGEIGFECGMNHTSHFINLFREREHMTPLAYRKRWRE